MNKTTESENHRTGQVGRTTVVTLSTVPAQAGSSQSTGHRIVRKPPHSGQSVPVLAHSTLLMFRWSFLSISFCPLALLLLLAPRKACSIYLASLFRYLCTFMRCPLSCLFWRLNNSLSFSSQEKLSRPLTESVFLLELLQELHVS